MIPPMPAPPEVETLLERAREAEHALEREEARHLYERALRGLAGTDDCTLASTILRWIGRTYLDEGHLIEAEDCFAAALASAEAGGDLRTQAYVVNNQAIVVHTRGHMEEAVRLYRWAGRMAHEVGDRVLEAMVRQNLGIIANIRGDFGIALEHYEASLLGYRLEGIVDRCGPVMINIGRVLTDLGRRTEAERMLQAAHDSCAGHGDLHHQILSLVNLTRLWLHEGDIARARLHCDTARSLSRSDPADRWSGVILKHDGIVLRESGKLRESEQRLEDARRVAQEQEDRLLEAEVARALAETHNLADRGPETLRWLNEAHRLFSEIAANRDLEEIQSRLGRLEARFLEIVQEWGGSIESKDRYTQGHCIRVADYACALARAVGMAEETLIWFRMGALLHDVGKVSVPSRILNKDGPLTPREWETMKRHAEVGVELLADVHFPWDVRPMIRHHHEKWDGSGYPDGRAGEDIPLSARILCVADVFDALTSERSYRKRCTTTEALEIMASEAGRSFDPHLFEVFRRQVAPPAPRTPVQLPYHRRRRPARPTPLPTGVAREVMDRRPPHRMLA